ncbi:MAG: hypothetical protein WCF85_12285 [Rhodospirillaceae bacterium]
MLSLYRKHQRLTKFEEWSNAARFSLPVAVTMNVAGCTSVADGGWSMLAVSAAVSVVGWWAHKKVSAALTKFVAKVAASRWLRARYARDARIGREEDHIAQLEQEQTAALMAAALAAKNGHAVTAGLFYGLAKRAEGRLRHHGR